MDLFESRGCQSFKSERIFTKKSKGQKLQTIQFLKQFQKAKKERLLEVIEVFSIFQAQRFEVRVFQKLFSNLSGNKGLNYRKGTKGAPYGSSGKGFQEKSESSVVSSTVHTTYQKTRRMRSAVRSKVRAKGLAVLAYISY